MADLRIKDLVVEYSSGGYAVRPIDGLNIEVTAGSLALLLGPNADFHAVGSGQLGQLSS